MYRHLLKEFRILMMVSFLYFQNEAKAKYFKLKQTHKYLGILNIFSMLILLTKQETFIDGIFSLVTSKISNFQLYEGLNSFILYLDFQFVLFHLLFLNIGIATSIRIYNAHSCHIAIYILCQEPDIYTAFSRFHSKGYWNGRID